MSRLTALYSQAKYIFQTEGLISLLRAGFTFLAGCFFRYETYYLYEVTAKERNEADFMPRIQDFTLKVVTTSKQLDELAAEGFDLSSPLIKARQRLEGGAVAFCIFVKGELANIGWVAMTREAQKNLDKLPYKIDFSKNEAYLGWTETSPKYRWLGLMVYSNIKQIQFLEERGRTARTLTVKHNIAPQRSNAKLGYKLYAEARYLQILWWKSWKERRLTSNSHEAYNQDK